MERLKVIIGRNPQCDFPIDNPEQHRTVSGNHGTLSETDRPDIFLYEDHSTNGTYINGQLLHNASCKVGFNDRITLGKTYILPLADIARRYFSHSRATVKKPRTDQIPDGIYATPTPVIPMEVTYKPVAEPTFQNPQTPEPQGEIGNSLPPINPDSKDDMKKWYWIVTAGSIILGILIGLIIIYV